MLDLHLRRIVGWSIRETLHAEGAVDALKYALADRQPGAGLIHHSDRGVQYASDGDQEVLKEVGAVASMSRKGDCWDNAPMESFFGRMKRRVGQ